ncbi:MAG: hypothetical protein NTZ17_16105 [Phycisphaerae bacterium]|nr:hypothetical protein [Phycisphaerae bacterium]
MNRRHMYLLAVIAAILALERQAPAAEDAEAQFVAAYMPAERTNTPTGVTTDSGTVRLDVIARF